MSTTQLMEPNVPKPVKIHRPDLVLELRRIGVSEREIASLTVSRAKSRLLAYRLRNTMMMQERPYLFPILRKLGVQPEFARKLTVERAYWIIKKLIREMAGEYAPGMATTDQLYWLFTHGVGIENSSLTEEQAQNLLEMIWASKRK